MTISRSGPNSPTWGGEGGRVPYKIPASVLIRVPYNASDLLQHLRAYCQLLKSSLQPHLFLVDPSKADIEAHTTVVFEDLDFEHASSPIPVHRRPARRSASEGRNQGGGLVARTSVLHDSLDATSSARMAILSGFSHLTRATRHAAQSVLSHPLAKPVRVLRKLVGESTHMRPIVSFRLYPICLSRSVAW